LHSDLSLGDRGPPPLPREGGMDRNTWAAAQRLRGWGPNVVRELWGDAQGLVQLRLIENIPKPIDDLAIGLCLVCDHELDRSQHKGEKRVAAAQQRRLYGGRTNEIA
jgi:hypothetical protein